MFEKLKKVEQEMVIPVDSKIRKSSYTTKIVYENGSFLVKKVTKYKVYSVDFHRWLSEKPNLVELLPLSSLGNEAPQKQVSIPVIIMRPCVDPETTELTDGFFLHEATYKVSNEYPSVYLAVARNICVQTHLLNGQSFPLPVFEPIKGVSVTLNDKPKRISKAEAVQMEKKGTPIFNKEKSGELKHFIAH